MLRTILAVVSLLIGYCFGVYVIEEGYLCVKPVPANRPAPSASPADTSGGWYYTYNPSVAGIDPNTGVVRTYSPGKTTMCKQKSKSDTTIVRCWEVVVLKK